MPRLSVWMIRTSLVFLLVGFTLGAVMLAQRAVPFAPGIVVLGRPLHAELLTLGWIANLGLGVGYWILPRYSRGAARGGWRPVLAFVALNIGVLTVGLSRALGAPAALPLAGRLAEAGAALMFGWHVWGRVRPGDAGTRVRPHEGRR